MSSLAVLILFLAILICFCLSFISSCKAFIPFPLDFCFSIAFANLFCSSSCSVNLVSKSSFSAATSNPNAALRLIPFRLFSISSTISVFLAFNSSNASNANLCFLGSCPNWNDFLTKALFLNISS